MYSFSDLYPIIHDNSGNPLVGKLVFLDATTLASKPVYSKDGNELDSTQYVNGATTQQIFLNGSYRVDVYKTISDSDYLLQRTFEISQPLVPSVLPEDVLSGIAELKEYDTTTLEDGFAVRVSGYYSNDDCPMRTYVWRKDYVEDADNGLVVKGSSETGRWILLNPYSWIDVRWYGDIPQASSTGSSFDSQRKLAQYAANKYGKDLYFGISDNSSVYYIFTGSDYDITGNLIVDGKARFVVNLSSASSYISIHANQIVHSPGDLIVQVKGSYKLAASWIRTSWYSKGYAYSASTWTTGIPYIVDSTRVNTFVDCKIFVENGEVLDNLILNNVELISGSRFISPSCNIINCDHVSDTWFEEGTDFSRNVSFMDNKFHIADFENKTNYFVFKNLQSESDYGDLEGNTVNGPTLRYNATFQNGTVNNAVLLGDVTASNATLTVNSADTSSKLTLDNVVLSCYVDIDSITAKNSTIKLGNSTHTYAKIDLTDCALNHSNGIYVNELVLDSCNCDGHVIYVNASTSEGIYTWKVINSSNVALTESPSTTTVSQCTRNCICFNNRDFNFNDSESKVTKFSDDAVWEFDQDWTQVKLTYEGNEVRVRTISYPALGCSKILYDVPVSGDVRNYLVVNVQPDFDFPYTTPTNYNMEFRFELKSGSEYYLTTSHITPYSNTSGIFKQIVGSFSYDASIASATCTMYYRLRK